METEILSTSIQAQATDLKSVGQDLRRYASRLNSDKVVIEIGSMYWKVGMSGESSPRFILPFSKPLPYESCLSTGADGLTRDRQVSLFQSP